jgi:hypothetical protein
VVRADKPDEAIAALLDGDYLAALHCTFFLIILVYLIRIAN